MIKLILRDGAGNQLFQYAVGRYLSYLHGSPLYFDISLCDPNRYKQYYILPRFHVVGKTLNPLLALILRRIVKIPLWRLSWSPIYYEKTHQFDELVFALPRSCTLFGWFQSEKYFKPIADIIRNDLSFKDFIPDNDTLALEKKILSSHSISIHVRRGDYVNDERFDICTMKYYEKAMETVREKIIDPHFYVFSDDIQWCKRQFFDSSCTFVDLQQSREDPLNDMRLMSICKHNIIANSSFSWWAAWLNNNPQKIVVCPYIWFNFPNVPIEDKMCEGWLKITF